MEVITDRPIYSYLTAEEKKAKRQAKAASSETRKAARKEKLDTVIQNPFFKTLAGATGGYVQDWAQNTVVGGGSGASKQTDPAYNVTILNREQADAKEAEARAKDEARKKRNRNIIIGVSVVAVLGVATYFILKARKGKKATAKK